MASPVNFQCYRQRLVSRINLRRRSPQNLSFHVSFPAIRASSSSSNPKPSSLLKTTCITLAATAALFSASLYIISKPVLTKPDESTLEKHLETDSTDAKAILSLAKLKFESNNYDQSIELINRLIQIEPEEEPKWFGMKARILSYTGKTELAIKAFEEILAKDPVRVDAYHYLLMECYDSKPKLAEIEKRIQKAIRKAKEIRGLRMLIAQIRVIEGKPLEAISICEDLVKDGTRDFRVYLFQGLVYSLMKNGDEAGKRFEEVARLLLVDPYVMNANKVSEWRVIVEYDDVYCYLNTFAKLLIASALEKFN